MSLDPTSGAGDPRRSQRATPDRVRALRGSFLGMMGMAATLFLVVGSIGVLPVPAVVGLGVLWLVLFVLAVRWFLERPRRVVLLPVPVVVAWFAVVLALS